MRSCGMPSRVVFPRWDHLAISWYVLYEAVAGKTLILSIAGVMNATSRYIYTSICKFRLHYLTVHLRRDKLTSLSGHLTRRRKIRNNSIKIPFDRGTKAGRRPKTVWLLCRVFENICWNQFCWRCSSYTKQSPSSWFYGRFFPTYTRGMVHNSDHHFSFPTLACRLSSKHINIELY